jgi:predicted DNA-binding transcriptional regulator YafY
VTRSERLAALLLYLQSRRGADARRVTAAEVAAHFGISRRTVLRDMAALSVMGVPVESADGASGGYALPADFPLAPLPLNLREALLLLFALDGLRRLSDAPFGDARVSLVAKLRAMLSEPQRAVAERWLDKLSLDVPERAAQPALFLDLLLTTAQRGGWVAARYRSESGGEANHTLFPRHVSTHSGFWYCRAWSHERTAERTFRVDRFISVLPTDPPPGAVAVPPDERRPYDHPDHPEVRALLTLRGVAVAEREPHLGHAVERNVDGSGGAMTFRCPPSELDYWARFFLRLAGDATVLAPPELRARLRDLAQEILVRHAEP